ncbi:MAG: DUF6034 family protein [Clostridia bacterium]|nr:DUF6034 family protein [Clostridia bacterium]
MSKNKQIFIILLSLVLLLCACQETPKEDFVIPKDGTYEAELDATAQPRQEQDASSQPQQELELPETWSEDISMDGWTFRIDAEIKAADMDAFPVYETALTSFENIEDELKPVMYYFARDAVSKGEFVRTKSYYYDQIKAYIEMGWYDFENEQWMPHSDEEIAEHTAFMQTYIDNAPADEPPFTDVTPTVDNMEFNMVYELSDGTRVRTWTSGSTHFAVFVGDETFDAILQPESWVLEGDAFPGEPVGTQIEVENLTLEQATATANAFIEEVGIEGFGLASAEKGRMISDYSVQTIEAGYIFTLTRNIGGYLCLTGTTGHTALFSTEDETYSRYLIEETIEIFVTEDGVKQFVRSWPYETPVLVNENVKLLSFDEVQSVIRTHLKNFLFLYEHSEIFTQEVRMQASELTLVLGMVQKKNDPDRFYLSPVWVLKVNDVLPDGSVDSYSSYMHINAVDGTLLSYGNYDYLEGGS